MKFDGYKSLISMILSSILPCSAQAFQEKGSYTDSFLKNFDISCLLGNPYATHNICLAAPWPFGNELL